MAAARSRPPSAGDHEQALAGRGVRKGLGAYYTPPDVVAGLLALTLEPLLAQRRSGGIDAVAALRVLDPACGTGNFLVAAAGRLRDTLVDLGLTADDAAARAVRCVRGVELDERTAKVCRAGLRSVHPSAPSRSVRQGDALSDASLVTPGAFDLVIGNPPFLNQLASSTARSPDEALVLRKRFGDRLSAYTDPAVIFLLLAHEAVRPDGGVACLVEPLSFVSARDAGRVRMGVLVDTDLRAIWLAGEPVFDAAVDVCAPILVRGPTSGPTTQVVRGRSFTAIGSAPAPTAGDASWSGLLAWLHDLPDPQLATDGVLGDVAEATADFRDQYYGLAGHVVDRVDGGPDQPRLVTSGLIDPGRLLWGERSCRFNKASFTHPRVEVTHLEPHLQAWAQRRLVPKVLVATQTKVLEAVVDAPGTLLPSVPVVTVTAPGELLWRVGAVLSSPVASLVAARRHLGAGRNATALRLSAVDLLALPLPADAAAWASAAEHVRAGRLVEAARRMNVAFGLAADHEVLAWWQDRCPRPGAR